MIRCAASPSASVGISTASYVADSRAVIRRDADSRAIASGSLYRFRAAPRVEAQRQVVQLGAIETRPDHPAPAAHDREGKELPIEQEVVPESGGYRIADLGHPVPEALQQCGRLQRQLAELPDWPLAQRIRCRHAMRSRCFPAWVTSPMGGSFGLR